MRKILVLSLSIMLCLWVGQAYDQHDDYKYIMHYYEENSQYPIVHAYYNDHFSKSRQFEDFLGILEETEYRNKDFGKFLLTNCEKLERMFLCEFRWRNAGL